MFAMGSETRVGRSLAVGGRACCNPHRENAAWWPCAMRVARVSDGML